VVDAQHNLSRHPPNNYSTQLPILSSVLLILYEAIAPIVQHVPTDDGLPYTKLTQIY